MSYKNIKIKSKRLNEAFKFDAYNTYDAAEDEWGRYWRTQGWTKESFCTSIRKENIFKVVRKAFIEGYNKGRKTI